jgi:YkgG family uncharacterized protein
LTCQLLRRTPPLRHSVAAARNVAALPTAEPAPKLDLLNRVAEAMRSQGIDARIVETGAEARDLVLELVPEGAEVHSGKSKTIDDLGFAGLMESGRYDAIRPKLQKIDRSTHGREMRKLGAAPDVELGSVAAVTEDGALIAASATGNNLAAYAGGAGKVIFVVGSQKIVKNSRSRWSESPRSCTPRGRAGPADDGSPHEAGQGSGHLRRVDRGRNDGDPRARAGGGLRPLFLEFLQEAQRVKVAERIPTLAGRKVAPILGHDEMGPGREIRDLIHRCSGSDEMNIAFAYDVEPLFVGDLFAPDRRTPQRPEHFVDLIAGVTDAARSPVGLFPDRL